MICKTWNWKSNDGESHDSQLCTAVDEFTYLGHWAWFKADPPAKWHFHPRMLYYRLRLCLRWKWYDIVDDKITSGITVGIGPYSLFVEWNHYYIFGKRFVIRIRHQAGNREN